MADIESSLWSELAANNTAPSPDGWPPNSSPNIVYTTDREGMGAIKRTFNRQNATVTSGGSANAQTLTYTVNPTAMVRGQRYAFIAGFANTGAMTLAVGGLAATAVQVNGAPLVGGELKVGLITEVIYDGIVFEIIAGSGAISGVSQLPVGNGTGTASVNLNKGVGAFSDAITGNRNSLLRWELLLGNATAEPGSGNVGSDFEVQAYSDAGSYLYSPFSIARSSGAVTIKGDTTGGAVVPGSVGEYISAVVGSPGITLTTSTGANVTSVSLTAGDWDVSGEVWINVGTGGATVVAAAISTTSAALPAVSLGASRAYLQAAFPVSAVEILTLAPTRISLAATTTVYLVGFSTFPSGTTTAYGRIGARRMR